ncbi:hypothetical protein VNO78_12381 [Psophocarpus tetragonolobus]|uniref:C2H2-type domain-containing protein n=1 Tax=Psophocarpus tetragonolobus TaxID=3891 RepID=A0AAN9SMX1_PSOTE
MDDDDVNAAKNPSLTVRECDICGKTFGSGKAFGGHRRSHFLKKKKRKVGFTSKGDDNSNNSDDDSDEEEEEKNICCICKKEFPSKNSLYGHMRAHSKRSWRGVSPPTHSSLISIYVGDDLVWDGSNVISSYEHHIDAIDLEKFTSPSWLKKDVRGRGCIGIYEVAETLAHFSAYAETNRVFAKKG